VGNFKGLLLGNFCTINIFKYGVFLKEGKKIIFAKKEDKYFVVKLFYPYGAKKIKSVIEKYDAMHIFEKQPERYDYNMNIEKFKYIYLRFFDLIKNIQVTYNANGEIVENAEISDYYSFIKENDEIKKEEYPEFEGCVDYSHLSDTYGAVEKFIVQKPLESCKPETIAMVLQELKRVIWANKRAKYAYIHGGGTTSKNRYDFIRKRSSHYIVFSWRGAVYDILHFTTCSCKNTYSYKFYYENNSKITLKKVKKIKNEIAEFLKKQNTEKTEETK